MFQVRETGDTMKRYKLMAMALVAALLLSALPVSAATTERDAAVAYLVEQGIYKGDTAGNLHLESGLSRAELAVILTRIREDEQLVLDNLSAYTLDCHFTDVPGWAKPYVGYCSGNQLMNGYSMFSFGPSDPVNPQAACTVVLRHLQYPETDWNYSTAISKAVAVGLAPQEAVSGSTITRGDFAVIIYRAMTGMTDLASTPPGSATVKGQTMADGSGSVSDTKLTYKLVDGMDLSREDFSQQANPAIFHGSYTRGMYNALRQSYLDRDIIDQGSEGNNGAEYFNPFYSYANATPATYELSQQYEAVISNISVHYSFQVNAEPYVADLWKYPGYFIVTAMKMEYIVDAETQTVLERAKNLPINDALQTFNDHVRSRISYDSNAAAGIERVFTSSERVKGACGTYANSFMYLCEAAGISSILISGDNHAWVMAYVDGQWYHCDPTNDRVMHETIKYTPYHPQNVEWMKEILVPGSTK